MISTFILGYIQRQTMTCPFNLLATCHRETAGHSNKFSFIPRALRRRVFVLTAQFYEVVHDVVQMADMCYDESCYTRGGGRNRSR